MAHWLLKSEAETWSWDMQVKRGARGEVWSGVRNHMAKNYLLKMKLGERAFFYHSGSAKQIVGIVEVIREAYPDPTDPTGRFVAVTVKSLNPSEGTGIADCRQGGAAPQEHGSRHEHPVIRTTRDGFRMEDGLQHGGTFKAAR